MLPEDFDTIDEMKNFIKAYNKIHSNMVISEEIENFLTESEIITAVASASGRHIIYACTDNMIYMYNTDTKLKEPFHSSGS